MAEAPSVTVYSTPTCPWCDRAKAYLAQHGVPFKDVDVSKDYNAAMEMVRLSGQQGVPVTVADGEVILGFDQARLAKIAAKYAGPKRPPLGILAKHPELAEKVPAGTKGVYVGKIRPQTVAERAGLQPGDILTSFAGKRVRSMAQLDQMVDTLKAGDQATAKFLRNGEDHSVILQF
jgi:glutaredoxin-like YruB-family protein